MKTQFVFGILIVALATCSVQPGGQPDSGVEGRVVIGPMCPVVQVGQDCPNAPYPAVLSIKSLEGERLTQVQADAEGLFRIPLEPGNYILHPESDNAFPFADEQSFHVEDGKFTQLTVTYDSGIR